MIYFFVLSILILALGVVTILPPETAYSFLSESGPVETLSAMGYAASFGYQHAYPVSRKLHAVERIRMLFSQVFDYSVDLDSVSYGVNLPSMDSHLDSSYVVFAHSTTWDAKHWPEIYWRQLADRLKSSGTTVYLPWVTEEERARAERIAENREWVKILPRVSLNEIATILKSARAVVGVDTGLSHISACVDTPIVAIYGATSAGLARPYGQNVLALQSDYHCSPCMKKQCRYVEQGDAQIPPCYAKIDLNKIERFLQPLLVSSQTG